EREIRSPGVLAGRTRHVVPLGWAYRGRVLQRVRDRRAPQVGRPAAAVPLLAVAAASVLLGTIGTASELGPDDLSPRTAAAWRTVLGAVALVAASWRLGAAPWRYRLPPAWLVAGAAVLA